MALRIIAFSRLPGGWTRANADLHPLTDVLAAGEDFAALGVGSIGVVSWLYDGGLGADDEVVALMEDQDWFAILTVRGREVYQFVSDYDAAMGSELGELFADLPIEARYGWAGDPELLAALGVGHGELADMAEIGMSPEIAVAEIAEAIGAAELFNESV